MVEGKFLLKAKCGVPLIVIACVVGALAALASRRIEEVQLRNISISPAGLLEARVEDHIYGPHFGGETPAVEVHLKRISGAIASETIVFQADSEVDVDVEWIGNNKLQIRYSNRVVPSILLRASQGVNIDAIPH